MRRLQRFDAALLLILVPLWAMCFTIHIYKAVRGEIAVLPLMVMSPENADSYPTVRAVRSGREAEAGGLLVGDQLIRVGEANLLGVGAIGFIARVFDTVDSDLRVPVFFVRAGEQGMTSLRCILFPLPWLPVPRILAFVVIAVLALLTAPRLRTARAFFLASMAYCFQWTYFWGGSSVLTYTWLTVYFFSALVLFPLCLRAILIFAEEMAQTETSLPAGPWFFTIFGPIAISAELGEPLPPVFAFRAVFIVNAAFTAIMLALLMRTFRHAGPLVRRQIKWILYGVFIGNVPVLLADVIVTFNLSLSWLHHIAHVPGVVTPFCIFIALVHLNFFDIDRVISVTLSYTLLVLFMVILVIILAPNVSQAASTIAGVSQPVSYIMTTLVVLMVLIPGEPYLRTRMERWLFADRYLIDRGVHYLLQDMSKSLDEQSLLTLIGERLDMVLQPENCVIYGQQETIYTPLFVRGTSIPPVIPLQSPFVSAMQTNGAPLDIERWRHTARAQLAPEDYSIVDQLRAAIALPLRCGTASFFFLSLGKKRSGDVYTSTDVALLATVARSFTAEAQRCEATNPHEG